MTSRPSDSTKPASADDGSGVRLPLSEFLRIEIIRSGKQNVELARELGYVDGRGQPKGNVIAMMKSGSMALPLNMLVPMAKAIEVDAVLLLRKKLEESTPGMWEMIQDVMDNRLVSQNERDFIRQLQQMTREIDPPFVSDSVFVDEVTASVGRLIERRLTSHRENIEKLNKSKPAGE